MRKNILITSIIIFVMALCYCPFLSLDKVYAKASEEISRKNMIMNVGEKNNIRIQKTSAKVSWSSTNNKIAKVYKTFGKKNQRATIVAGKKAGQCTIKAKVKGRTYKCKVVVNKGMDQKKYSGSISKFSVVKVTVSNTDISIRVKMSNAAKKFKWYGYAFYIQKYVDGTWKDLEMEENVAFREVAIGIPSKTSIFRTYNTTPCYDRALFTSGKYRIHVSYKCSNQYAEFLIK